MFFIGKLVGEDLEALMRACLPAGILATVVVAIVFVHLLDVVARPR
jgi:hypothetical protein